MNLWVELGNRLDLVIPSLLLPGKSSDLDGAHALLLSLEAALGLTRLNVLAHKSPMVCLWQFHWVELGPEEGNLRALTNCALDILEHAVTIRLILLEHEGCRILTALKVLVRIDGRAALLLVRPVRFEADWGVSRRSTSVERSIER